ncbi:MAG: AAA family ATPase, partial [Bacilli bacterium]|nr:AAA family ATPase [Bacilli bacterium]
MYRKYIENLIEWKNSHNRKPLMVWGARQVGKTYLIKEIFAKEYFPNKYIYVDCRTERSFVDYCMEHVNAKEIIEYLSLDKDMVIDKDTLLIFDEVQECLPIITLMKYFCQDFKEIPVIVTGSMVRIKIQRENRKRGLGNKDKFLFPV